jgi:2Fe-2S ferredoxin
MAIIIFESKRSAPMRVEVPQGGAICDVCDEKEAPIPFSCRSASCGTCCLVVLEGEGELTAPADEELDVLDALGYEPPKYRLACQAQMKPGTALVRVRSVDE